MCSANSKVGKTQITDFIFVYWAYKFCKEHGIPIKIFYFSLEQDKKTKMIQAFSYLLNVEHGIRLSPKDLRSTEVALSQEILDKITEFRAYFDEFEEAVTYIEDVKNPYGIYKTVRTYCESNGTTYYKEIGENKYFDYYKANNEDEYVISITDHASLLTPENGKDLRSAMGDMSKYNILLRNNFGVSPVLVQQQASAQESLDNFKMNKLIPSFSGLADCKDTQRDIDLAIGLFTPHRHEIKKYAGYDIKKLKDNIRFMTIMGGREGGFGEIAPLYFDGAVNIFKEMPLPNDMAQIEQVYNHISKFRNIGN